VARRLVFFAALVGLCLIGFGVLLGASEATDRLPLIGTAVAAVVGIVILTPLPRPSLPLALGVGMVAAIPALATGYLFFPAVLLTAALVAVAAVLIRDGRELISSVPAAVLRDDRSALERIAEREFNRARRHERPLTILSLVLTPSAGRSSRGSRGELDVVAQELAASLRRTDVVALEESSRLAVLLPETSGSEAEGLLMRILPHLVSSGRLRVGAATFPDDDVTWIGLRAVARDRERPVDPNWPGDGETVLIGEPGSEHGVRQAESAPIVEVVETSSVKLSVFRRATDLLVVLVVAPVAAPLIGVLGVAIKLDTSGPVFFGQRRIGRGGQPFRLWKLRTMVRDAEKRKDELRHLSLLEWPDFKIPDDPRVTRVGRFLRKTSLDELPQLWNLFVGDITLVGPRPSSIDVAHYELWQTERLEATPGLFGRWQAEARGNADFADRCRLDIDQVRSRTVRSELRMIAKTIEALIRGRGAC
jgi:lipopolysaccharide/colanic/teichoic acid biosynthesis glycosyltransferase